MNKHINKKKKLKGGLAEFIGGFITFPILVIVIILIALIIWFWEDLPNFPTKLFMESISKKEEWEEGYVPPTR